MQGGGWGGGSSDTPCCFMLWNYGTKVSSDWLGYLDQVQTVPSVVNTLINSQNLFKIT